MNKTRILRVCHKFLINEDGYDLDIQDLCFSTSDKYDNYVLTYINMPLKEYIKKNNLIEKNSFLYSSKLKTYIFPIKFDMKYNNYLKDLYSLKTRKIFKKIFTHVYNLLKPEIVSIHGTLLPQFVFSAKYSKNKSKVIVNHPIGLINQNYKRQRISILISKYFIHNLLPLYSNKVICVSNHGKDSFHFFKKNVVVVNPISLITKKEKSDFKKTLKNNLLKNNFNIRKNDKVFCVVGRISVQKNQLKIISAFNEVLKKHLNFKLIIIGKSSNEKYFKKVKVEINKHKNNYCLLNELKNNDVINVVENSDFLISASINEGFGRNAMEAILLGTPVIASKFCGHTDFIDENENGLLVNPNKIHEIVKAILNIDKIKIKHNYTHKFYISEIKKIYGDKYV